MSEKKQNAEVTKPSGGVVVVDMKRMWRAICKRIPLIIVATLLGGILSFLGTKFLITPKYEAAAMFYVNNSGLSLGDVEVDISSSDISASRSLVESYIVILNTRTTLEGVIDYAEVDYTYTQLQGMITAEAVNSTEIFKVVVTSHDPQEAADIANAVSVILPKRIQENIDGTHPKVVDGAIVPTSSSYPVYSTNVLLGLLIGLILSVGVTALVEFFDVTMKSLDDVNHCCDYPILAAVPSVGNETKPGYGKYRGKHVTDIVKDPMIVGSERSFVVTEAYKLLRTKLQFSFADENASHVIVVSSAMEGEGKSVTAINLAESLSQLDKKVLLIECDMRRPSISEKIRILRTPGLSNYLTGQEALGSVLQSVTISKESLGFTVMPAGSTPPNPIELLSSKRMENLLETVKGTYDYILLDLPPVCEVSDAMVAANMADGVLLVSRQNYCNRLAFGDAVRQFEFVGARILGVLVNSASEETGVYGKKYYKYSKYGRYRKYGYYASGYSRYAKPEETEISQ